MRDAIAGHKCPTRKVLLALTVFFTGCQHAGTGAPLTRNASTAARFQVVERLDPALDQVISSAAQLEMLKEEQFGLAEGPLWIDDDGGYLLFSDIHSNEIYKWQDGTLSSHLARSGYTGPDGPQPSGSVRVNGGMSLRSNGSNGIALDREGRVVFCATGDRAIVRIEKDGTRTTLAERYDGKRLNRPNDLVVRSDGRIYFTDPRPGDSPDNELSFSGAYVLHGGKLDLLEQGLSTPNGLAFSPDERFLYLGSYVDSKVFRYDVQADGTITNRRVFVDMRADTIAGNPDGMKVDRKGNLYTTGPGGVWIVSPEGKHLGTIRIPGVATNVAFGDPDTMTLYITTRRSLARIRLLTPGIRP